MSHVGKLHQMPKQICMVGTDTLGKTLSTHSAENSALTLFGKMYE